MQQQSTAAGDHAVAGAGSLVAGKGSGPRRAGETARSLD